ncbi:hypothetical protein CIHG_05718 [Coccidioides immitis H538.4]|uniref:Uncharacterized protein n=2 Tax=Coccidioides immitis TaxID=5501 RepID=A0A0J8RTN8_COCIT|nr:hypothetical protein CIRG_08500 [Coccidioides immitis RMSCC 2394]KMU87951.1 hypothetical protein CIHG_05718 [Coccidioides immitis H538.4]
MVVFRRELNTRCLGPRYSLLILISRHKPEVVVLGGRMVIQVVDWSA